MYSLKPQQLRASTLIKKGDVCWFFHMVALPPKAHVCLLKLFLFPYWIRSNYSDLTSKASVLEGKQSVIWWTSVSWLKKNLMIWPDTSTVGGGWFHIYFIFTPLQGWSCSSKHNRWSEASSSWNDELLSESCELLVVFVLFGWLKALPPCLTKWQSIWNMRIGGWDTVYFVILIWVFPKIVVPTNHPF